jgi:hypothetical protein
MPNCQLPHLFQRALRIFLDDLQQRVLGWRSIRVYRVHDRALRLADDGGVRIAYEVADCG